MRSTPAVSNSNAGTQARMREDEIPIDTALARALLAEQFPQFAGEPITVVRSTGTVNALYRLGDDLCVRLTRVPEWADGLGRERIWLPALAPHITLAIPEPVAQGRPTEWYPYPWAIYRWVEGLPYADERISDERAAAIELATFIKQLRAVDVANAPRGGRAPLRELDAVTRIAIEQCGSLIDARRVSAIWTRAVQLTPWQGQPVWIHGDLLRPNLLVREGDIVAVLDFGGVGIGDPAFDIIPAWAVFNRPGRAAFRAALSVDGATWQRARAYALHQALLIIPYYVETNPEFVALALRTVEQILADSE